MRSTAIALLLLMLGACASSTGASKASSEPTPHTRDQGCVDDCLGNGGNRSFCEDRCSY
jgi:hypothetical protein